MNTKVINRAFGLFSFIVALIVYLITVQPSVPFWDCGEFTAASIWQQVPHPPGAPLFLMLGKLFHILIPFGDPGWRVNLVSVFSSAFTVWLLYLIIGLAIKNFRKEAIETFEDAIKVYGSALIGSLALVFSDTFWFNAVESEVYAMSSLFVAVIVYLMMKWNEQADAPGNERYLLLIAYLMGLSTGVHLLAILAIFSIVYLVYFKKYQFKVKSFIITGIISVIVFFVLYPGIVKWVPSLLQGDLPFTNACREHIIEDSPVITILAIGLVLAAFYGLWYGYKHNKSMLNLICGSFILMILGYSTYIQILLRSNANPPMNENEPKNLKTLTSYLGREQYGSAPNWPRRYQADDDYYIRRYEKQDEKGDYVYGKWIRPERVSKECNYRVVEVPEFTKTNFAGEINYLWKYQIRHMYLRYFFWNFVGRMSDIQDAPEAGLASTKKDADKYNFDSGYSELYPIKFWALPLLFGLFGLIFHFYRDPKMAFIYLIMFLMMGVLAAIAQNQQEPQPRERDYFYAGSFFVFCLWIGISVYGLIELLSNKRKGMIITAPAVIISLLLVPLNMALGGWKMHSRAGNYIPFDYSYNILQSTEKDAIIFTNGDNDTFPLWYLQDVAGVRRDVRVVNLSLGNTLWYIDQLKNRSPWGAKKIPITFSNDSLRVSEDDDRALKYEWGEAMDITIPVKKEIFSKYTNDVNIINKGSVKFRFEGKPLGERQGKQNYLFRIQDKLIIEILRRIKFERPVYFSITVGPDAFCGLEPYFRNEGMAMRICPVQQKTGGDEAIDVKIMESNLLNIDNSNNYHKEPHYGFKFRNLNNKSVFYDEVHRRLMQSYRLLFVALSYNYFEKERNNLKAVAVLDTMNKYISPVQFPMGDDMGYQVAKIYNDAGAKKQAEKFALLAIQSTMRIIEQPELKPDFILYEVTGRYFGPFRRTASLYQMIGDYTSAKNIYERFYLLCQEYKSRFASSPMYQPEVNRVESTMSDILASIDELTIDEVKQNNGIKAAIDTAISILKNYQSQSESFGKTRALMYIRQKLQELGVRLDSAGNIMAMPQ